MVRFLFAVVNLLFFNWLAFYLKIKRDFLPISRGVFQGVFPGGCFRGLRSVLFASERVCCAFYVVYVVYVVFVRG